MALVRCDRCGFVYDFKADDIVVSVVEASSGKCTISWFYCPSCFSPSIASVVDDEWTELRDDLERAKSRYRKYMKLGDKTLLDNALKTVVRKRDKLSTYTDKLVDEVKSKFKVGTIDGILTIIPK